MSRHPADGELRAFLDGELAFWRQAATKMHLRGCPHCSERCERVSNRSARTKTLLASVSTSTDVSESWQRVLSRAEGPRALPARPGMLATGGLAVATVFAIGLLLMTPHTLRSGKARIGPGQVVLDTCCNADGDGIQTGVVRFVTSTGKQAVSLMYSDRDRSRNFSSGDVVHRVVRSPRAR